MSSISEKSPESWQSAAWGHAAYKNLFQSWASGLHSTCRARRFIWRGSMLGVFVAALFTSAALLFWVQPMVAKMLLPLLGGTPTVWITCMVFFQSILLAGYAYAHFLVSRFSLRVQVLAHVVLLLATFAALPVGLSAAIKTGTPWNSNPSLWMLGVLFTVVALPFFTLSTNGPLLQSWFSRTGHRSASDPYFLYAASNLGSLFGLSAYPLLVEPGFALPTQSRLWAVVYGLLVVFCLGCALPAWRRWTAPPANPVEPARPPKPANVNAGDGGITWDRRLRWILWAFIPSSLMLAVTTYLSTDIASVPLLWVVPLAIYLVTFILAFARRRILRVSWLERALPAAAVILVFVMLNNADNLAWLQIALHLLFLFLAGLLWHSRLADDRPPSARLTEFYFCLSIGGVLGGLFNAVLAPLIFRTVIEYRLMIVLACLNWPAGAGAFLMSRQFWRVLIVPAGIFLLTAGLATAVPHFGFGLQLGMLLIFGVPVILCYIVARRQRLLQFELALAAVLLGSHFCTIFYGRTLHVERNFFGSLRITIDPDGRIFRLYHGTTVHGMEFIAPERRGEPLAYYHRTGPCGQAMDAFNAKPGGTNVAAIGLGAGAMAAYARPGQHWTFFEIDPAVIRVAQDTNYFTFLQRCTNALVDFKLGDARLRLREASSNRFDLLVCDAFGSDAPPLHLLNREAMELYLSKLAPGGLLLFHVSSRCLDFRPVLANLADHLQLVAMANADVETTDNQLREGKLPSMWVALARRSDDLGPLRDDPRWEPLPPQPKMRLWTDDYSNILGIFEWE